MPISECIVWLGENAARHVYVHSPLNIILRVSKPIKSPLCAAHWGEAYF